MARATQLASDRKITNAHFTVMDALKMTFHDNSFDLVWACESGEHMPDKKLYVEEMTRVLRPGGRIIVATWCQRDEGEKPFTPKEEQKLDFLYSEWTHPHFISIQVRASCVCLGWRRCCARFASAYCSMFVFDRPFGCTTQSILP